MHILKLVHGAFQIIIYFTRREFSDSTYNSGYQDMIIYDIISLKRSELILQTNSYKINYRAVDSY